MNGPPNVKVEQSSDIV